MRDTVDPGPQRTATVKSGQALPQGDVNLLQQIASSIRVAFIRSRKPLQRRLELFGGLGVSPILVGRTATFTHRQEVVAGAWSFLHIDRASRYETADYARSCQFELTALMPVAMEG